MCCFSGPVRSVENTRIYARLTGSGTQMLVYSMAYASDQPVAMILPLPVAAPADPRNHRFITFKAYPRFFPDMEKGFARRPPTDSLMEIGARSMPGGVLTVESVGDFVASFVPTLRDFSRLDRRFRLPNSVWDQIPAYRNYSFAVFQLRETRATPTEVHPMALEFRTRLRNTIYFPTVHIHDGRVHRTEHFDHVLYTQDPHLYPSAPGYPAYAVASKLPLISSIGPLGTFVDSKRAQGVIDAVARCYRLSLRGNLENQDTLLRIA